MICFLLFLSPIFGGLGWGLGGGVGRWGGGGEYGWRGWSKKQIFNHYSAFFMVGDFWNFCLTNSKVRILKADVSD